MRRLIKATRKLFAPRAPSAAKKRLVLVEAGKRMDSFLALRNRQSRRMAQEILQGKIAVQGQAGKEIKSILSDKNSKGNESALLKRLTEIVKKYDLYKKQS